MIGSTCTSCKLNVLNVQGAVRFVCPKCNKHPIIRCPACRKTGVKYKCTCGFEGP